MLQQLWSQMDQLEMPNDMQCMNGVMVNILFHASIVFKLHAVYCCVVLRAINTCHAIGQLVQCVPKYSQHDQQQHHGCLGIDTFYRGTAKPWTYRQLVLIKQLQDKYDTVFAIYDCAVFKVLSILYTNTVTFIGLG